MLNKKIIFGVIVIVIALIVLLSFTLIPNKEETIKIGFIAPLTSGPSQWGQGVLNMMTIAVDEVNANGGINGKRIELIIEDGRCDSKAAVEAANKLIHFDKVNIIFGGACSSETSAIAPILQDNKVFGIANTSTATGILNDCEYCFRTSPPNIEQAKKIADIAVNKYGIKSIVFLTEQGTYSRSLSDDFIRAFSELGGLVVDDIEFGVEQADMRVEITKVKSISSDAVFVSVQSPISALNITKQMLEVGFDKQIIGSSVFVNVGAFKNSEIDLPESAFSANMFVDVEKPKMKALIEKYGSLYGEIPYDLFFVSSSYDGAIMLIEAMKFCEDDSGCLKNYFNNIKDWEGAATTYNFNENGDPILSDWKEIHLVDNELVFYD
jgi:branched-chain amino acid transport system substrate-binding protein